MPLRVSCVALLLVAFGCGGASTPAPAKAKATTPVATAAAPAKPIRGPLLWEVEKNGRRSWVFAYPPNGVANDELPELVWSTFGKSRAVAMVLDSKALKPEHLAHAFNLTGVRRLSTRLEKPEWKRVTRELRGILKPEDVDKFAPALAAVFLTEHGLQRNDTPSHFIRRARKHGKSVLLLDPQLKASIANLRAWGVKYLHMVLINLQTERDDLAANVAMYRAGNADGLRRAANDYDPADYDDPRALAAHNRLPSTVWLDKLLPALAAGELFVALDTVQVLHKTGLLAGLRTRGYTIRRIGVGTRPSLPDKALWRPSLDMCRAFLPRAMTMALREKSPAGDIKPADLAAAVEHSRPAVINACLVWTKKQQACYLAAKAFQEVLVCDRAPKGNPVDLSGPEEYSVLARAACACADNTCARGVFSDFVTWIEKNKKKQVSKAEARKVGEASRRITSCLMKHGIKPTEIMKALRSATK